MLRPDITVNFVNEFEPTEFPTMKQIGHKKFWDLIRKLVED